MGLQPAAPSLYCAVRGRICNRQNSLGGKLLIVIFTHAVPKPARKNGLSCATTSVSMETLIVQNSGPLMRNYRFTGRRPTWPHVSLEFSLLFANDLKGFKVR
jgi:hypothetical protein